MQAETVITSRSNPTVKKTAELLSKKARQESGLFRFDGIKLFREGFSSGLEIEYALLSLGASNEIKAEVSGSWREKGLPESKLFSVGEAVFEKLTEERAPEGIITVARIPEHIHRILTAEDAEGYNADGCMKILLAESLRDPGNLGTVIRSCYALGIERLVLSGDCADLYNPKTVRGAMGGLFRLKIDIFEDSALKNAVLSLKNGGRSIYAAALSKNAKDIGELRLREGDAFLIGNEGHGLSNELTEACGSAVIIPMREGAESLNAAAAAAICIWETVKSR